MKNGSINIHGLEISQLQALVSRYPWFSYAREVLLHKLVTMEPECLESVYKENLIFFPKRDQVLLGCRAAIAAAKAAKAVKAEMAADIEKAVSAAGGGDCVQAQETFDADVILGGDEDGFEIDFGLIDSLQAGPGIEVEQDVVVEEEKKEEKEPESKPKIFVVGGDYFSREDFEELDQSERAPEIKLGAPADNQDREAAMAAGDGEVDFESMDFVTETLAAIYADQGYYEKAIDAYAKLILLYPEKSSYFASLVNEIKLKN